MLSLSKITAVPCRRAKMILLHNSSKGFASKNNREDKPFTADFNRRIRNQKQEVDFDKEPGKPAVDWTHDQSLFPGARLAVEKKLAEVEVEESTTEKRIAAPTDKAGKGVQGSSVDVPAADPVDPQEKPSHGVLKTVYVKDSHTLESKGIVPGAKPFSPEDDPRDKSIQWEDFKRQEVYELLRHMEDMNRQTRKHGNRYMNAYTIYYDSLNKADFPYLQHMQTKNERELKAMSDDDLDLFITENRKHRLQGDSFMSYDAYLDELKKSNKFPEEEIEAERVRWHKEHDEADRLLSLRHPPFLNSRTYILASRKKAIWDLKDPRLEDLIPPVGAGEYTYQDWEHELRRDALSQILRTADLPPVAEKALTLKLELSKKPAVLGVPEQLSKYNNLGTTTKPLKEFHQKMLRIYGAHYELGEPNPKIPMDEQLEAGLSAAVLTAEEWVEPDKSHVLPELKATHDSWFAEVDEGELEQEDREIAAEFDQNETKALKGGVSEVDKSSSDDAQSEAEIDEEELEGRADDHLSDEEEQSDFRLEEKERNQEEAKRIKRRWKKGYKEPTTVAAYLKLLEEMEFVGNADVDYTQETPVVNAMVRYPDARYALGNEANLEPELEEEDEYPERPKNKAEEKETHNFPIKLADWEALKFKVKQHDAIPATLQTYFDPTLKRGNAEEQIMLENLDPGMKFISTYAPIPSPFPQPRVFHLDSDVKEAIWRFNRMDPKKYHSRKLAAMFGLSVMRTQSVLRLQYLEDQIAQEIGYDTELEVFEAEVEQTLDVQVAQWDPDFFDELKTHGGSFGGRQEYVDEGDLAILKRIERQRVSRYWNEYEMEILLEQNSQKHAYGALDNPLPPPVQLSTQKNPKQRHTVVLTDIADRRNGNFRIAVRDKNGVLREPDDAEFKRVRRRERGGKDYFNHIPYQFGEAI